MAETNSTVRIFNVVCSKLWAWEREERAYRERIASADFTSGAVEDMMKIASRKQVRHYLTMFVNKVEDHMELDPEERFGKAATGVKDEAEADAVIGSFEETLLDQYLSWHKPNSTSNAHVEIELYSHEALKEAVRAIRGLSW
ncbi:hypothetical protein BJD78_gp52 [Arthrobacter phage KellEzio]|uniref:Uncharacterized protein n=1 Tax=Arthrobacter phage KellEzio TaxID=1796995 RepID=A0A140G6D7_9CAUD|nr:hypothetical protein BJD78_gp52 [Arthrobacter phage KellEzio]AMM44222.1 hypothetical protein KELLEZIO_52 [Arthrobacter phage KellEzio]